MTLSNPIPSENRRRRQHPVAGSIIVLAAFLCIGIGNISSQPSADSSKVKEATFTTTISRQVTFRYLIYLPPDYTPNKPWPMVLYLHGSMGRGDDFDRLSWYPLPRLLRESGRSFPFIAVMPQCPADLNWMDSDRWIALIDLVRSLYTVDDERIAIVGYSLGAMGAWYLAYVHPERFAALAPMSGYANPVWADRLKNLPIWTFHGAKDDRIPVRESEEMVKALQARGADVRFSLDPERKHSPPSDEEHFQLFDWLLAQRRAPAAKLP